MIGLGYSGLQRKGEEGLVAGKRGLHDACHPRWPPPISAPPPLDPRAKHAYRVSVMPIMPHLGMGLQADPRWLLGGAGLRGRTVTLGWRCVKRMWRWEISTSPFDFYQP
jgi:hypothetical protein